MENKDYLRDALKEKDRIANMENIIRHNTNIKDSEQEKVIEQLYKTLEEIKKE